MLNAFVVEKYCPVCTTPVTTKSVTCSKACANTFFRSGAFNGNHRRGEKNYRTICFLYHLKKCVICGEDKIVDVHHYDENHDNNDPSNLIPICPTHHKYFHSRYRELVEAKLNEYREQFLEAVPLLEKYEEEIEFD